MVCNVDKLVLLVPEGHPLDRKGGVSMEKVFDENFVTLARSASLTRKVMAAAESVGRAPHIRVQVRSFDSMCWMVASGIGIAILPRAAATLYAQALKLAMMEIEGIDTERILLVAMRAARSCHQPRPRWSTCWNGRPTPDICLGISAAATD